MNSSPDHPAELPPLVRVLELPELAVFKEDRKTRVWMIRDGTDRRWVIKRYNRAGLRQKVQAVFGVHPLQKEALWHDRLAVAGLNTVPVYDLGNDPTGRRHQATPYAGKTFYDVLRENPAPGPLHRHALTRQAGRITGQLLALRVLYRDLKSTNLVVDEQGV
ncbi:MAG: hypothetical protein AAGL98_05645, partial [Planctomycetota bacterium]